MNAQERLVEHYEAAQDLAVKIDALRGIRSTMWMYTDSPGKEFSAEIGDAKLAKAKDDVRAAQARLKVAHVAYTDPFRRKPQNQEQK